MNTPLPSHRAVAGAMPVKFAAVRQTSAWAAATVGVLGAVVGVELIVGLVVVL